MSSPIKLTLIWTLCICFVCTMITIAVLHHRERGFDEFADCISKGGSTLNRRWEPTCRMPVHVEVTQ